MVDRKLLKQALNELVRLRNGTHHSRGFLTQLYASALREWADRLNVEPHKLNKLVLIREATSALYLH